MGIREKIQANGAITISIVVLALIAAIAYAIHSVSPSKAYSSAFFTTDDGKTTFVDSMSRVPPFDHRGAQAVRAWVFTCDGGRKRFVGYLERFTPAGKTNFEAAMSAYNAGKTHIPPTPGPADTEVKRPGAGNPWVSQADYQKADPITNIHCPDGGKLELALP